MCLCINFCEHLCIYEKAGCNTPPLFVTQNTPHTKLAMAQNKPEIIQEMVPFLDDQLFI